MVDIAAKVDFLDLTAEIVAAHVANNRTSASELPKLISGVHKALWALATPTGAATAPERPVPAVSARKSQANPDFLVSLIDGKPYKALKRHLAKHGLSPAEYRTRFGLKADYPMTAPSYSQQRRAISLAAGLGRKPKAIAQTTDTKSVRRTKLAPNLD